MTVLVVMVGGMMPILDAAIMHVALRALAVGLHMPMATTQWTVTAYLLAFTAAVPISSWAMHRFGPERVYLAALGIFTAASALCGMADSPWELIVARALQGAGGGLIGSVSRMMLVTAAGPKRLPRVMPVFGVPVMLVHIIGPLVGGGLLALQGWRAIFFINVPIGLASMAFARRLVQPRPTGPKRALDVVGLLLISPGLVGVVYGISQAGRTGALDSPMAAVPLGTGVVLIAAFVTWSVRDRRPLLDLRLYRHGVFRAAALSGLVTGVAVFGGTMLLPLYLQTVRGDDVWRTGLLIAPQGLGVAAATWLSGRLFERIGSITVLVGSGILLAATVPFAFLTPATSDGFLVTATVVRGIGIGLALTPAMTAAFQTLAPVQISEASTQFNALEHVGGSFGTALLVFAMPHLSRAHGHARRHVTSHGHGLITHGRGLIPHGRSLMSRVHGFDVAYSVLIAISALGVMSAVLLVSARRRNRPPVPAPRTAKHGA